MSLLVYLKVIPYPKFEHFGIIRLQTKSHTISNVLPTPTDIVGVGSNTTNARGNAYGAVIRTNSL